MSGISAWTEAQIDRLTELWMAGETSGAIAKKFGPGVSRSAVLGKINRLGLLRRADRFKPGRSRTAVVALTLIVPANWKPLVDERARVAGKSMAGYLRDIIAFDLSVEP